MKVNSAREYRRWIRDKRFRSDVNIDFIGCSLMQGNQMIKGFFELFHGFKDDIEKYLPSLLDIAEDNQAIYEFLQNAVDCGASHFWAFYNDQYFLAVNNGIKFSLDGISSILNIAQSTKTTSSSIGRLGIGFKLAHRLVGKGNGTQELVYGNKGPIMFSWDKNEQLASLMSSEPIIHDGLDENPFLFKIAITNFPANVDESVKNINYEDTVMFPSSELTELRTYVHQCLSSLYAENPSSFNQGTLFFIKLGENKKQLLDADLATLKNGIEYSMNTLKQLNNICFNGETILKKQLVLNEASIDKASDKFKEIEPQYKEYDILYSFGYLPLDFSSKDYYQAVSQLQKSPNFYKYFPMGDEVDNMALFIHSDSFQIEANRRKLTNHHTNRELLPVIAEFITETLLKYKETDRNKFLQLYASILLTATPSSQEKMWMHDIFFEKLYKSLKTCIPTLNGYSDNPLKIRVKKVKMDLPLDCIGHTDKQWFYWYGEDHKEIIASATDKAKLGLDEWNINDIIVNANITQLNTWLDTCSIDVFDAFIAEIKATTTSKEAANLLPQIKVFKVCNERKSYNEITEDADCLISTNRIQPIIPILKKVGMKCTDCTFESHPLNSLLQAQVEKQLFADIKSKIEDNENWAKLLPEDKLALVTTLKDFKEIGDESIKQLKIFNNIIGKQCSLGELTAYRETAETWQNSYIICKNENFDEIQKYLVSAEDFYSVIVENNYEDIVKSGSSIEDLESIYRKKNINWTDDFTIKLIKTYGSTEELLSIIEKRPSTTAFDEFLKGIDCIQISSDKEYPTDSFEYRCIKIAAKVESGIIRDKIIIDKISLKDFNSSNELLFKRLDIQGKAQVYTIKLSDVLPGDTQSAIYGKVSEMFSSITDYKKIFSANSNNDKVEARLKNILSQKDAIILPAQFLFILLTRWQINTDKLPYSWQNIIRFSRTEEGVGAAIRDVIKYTYDHALTDVLAEFRPVNLWYNYIKNKYLYSSGYTIEQERAYKELEEWCNQDPSKIECLKRIGFHFEDSEIIKKRKLFKEDKLDIWDGERYPVAFLNWVSSISPIEGSNQKECLISIANKLHSQICSLSFVEEDFDEGIEMDTSKYRTWKSKDNSISILKLSKMMPYRILSNGKVIARGNKGDYHYFPDTKKLYINGIEESEIVSVLAQVYQDRSRYVPFTFRDYVSVCFDSYEEQKKKDEKIKEYEEEIKKLKESQIKTPEEDNEEFEKYKKEYSEKLKKFLDGNFSMPSDKIKANHIISRYRALMYIKADGVFKFHPEFDEKSFIRTERYAKIPLSNGKQINIQSAEYGIWYVSPEIWNDIVEKGNYLYLCTGFGENDFMFIKNEDDIRVIAEKTKNVFIRMAATSSMNIVKTIKSVFSPQQTIYANRNVHLMLMVHPTKDRVLNSMFDTVFNAEGDFNVNDLG